jgi:hypothetical protein
MGISTVMFPREGSTLLARARALLKEGWNSSSVNELSVLVALQLMTVTSPEVTLAGGALRVKPRAKGIAAATTQSLANISRFVREE